MKKGSKREPQGTGSKTQGEEIQTSTSQTGIHTEGREERRPLGIPTIEDKIVQMGIKRSSWRQSMSRTL